MNNNKYFISFIFTIMISTLTLYFILKYAMSFGVYDDGYGTEIYSDKDWLVLSFSGLFLSVYSIYMTICAYKYKKVNLNITLLVLLVVSANASLYPLGVFFKQLIKGKAYGDIQWYLYIGIVGSVLLGLTIYTSIKAKKKFIQRKESKENELDNTNSNEQI